jgi:O-antigen/teichoic acid export membrane protein
VNTRRPSGFRSAAITFFSSQGRELSRQAVTLITWPIVVSSLGTRLFGAWSIVSQLAGFTNLGDLRINSALGVYLARLQGDQTAATGQQWLGAHLRVAARIAVLLSAAALALTAVAPRLYSVPDDLRTAFQFALLVSLTSVIIRMFANVPTVVLYSQHMGYKGTFVNIAVDAASLSFGALVAILGYGLLGLSLVNAAAAFVGFFAMLRIARRHVPWIGVATPNATQCSALWRTGLRYQFDGLVYVITGTGSVVLFGAISDLQTVGLFAIMTRLYDVLQAIAFRIAYAAGPSMGELSGQKSWARLANVWVDVLTVTTVAIGTALLILLPLNRPLLALMVGPEKIGSGVLSVLLASRLWLQAVQAPAAHLLNQSLRLKEKNRWSIAWALSFALLVAILAPKAGVEGMALACVLSSAVGVGGYVYEVCRLMPQQRLVLVSAIARPSVAYAVGVTIISSLVRLEPGSSLGSVIGVAAVLTPAAAAYSWFVAVAPNRRQRIVARLPWRSVSSHLKTSHLLFTRRPCAGGGIPTSER